MKGNGRCLICRTNQHFLRGTEENHTKSEREQPNTTFGFKQEPSRVISINGIDCSYSDVWWVIVMVAVTN
jgi:hypothetical protein